MDFIACAPSISFSSFSASASASASASVSFPWVVLGCLVFACWAAALCAYDFRSRRLPDFLTLPAVVAVAAVCLFLAPGAFSGYAWPALYIVQARMQGAGVGGGDIKLAAALGPVCVLFAGGGGLIMALFLSALFTVLWCVARRSRTAPHGPAMLLGTVISVA